VDGQSRPLQPVLRDEVYRIGREALTNAFRHAQAKSLRLRSSTLLVNCASWCVTTVAEFIHRRSKPVATDTGGCWVCASGQIELGDDSKFGVELLPGQKSNLPSPAISPFRIREIRFGTGSVNRSKEGPAAVHRGPETEQMADWASPPTGIPDFTFWDVYGRGPGGVDCQVATLTVAIGSRW